MQESGNVPLLPDGTPERLGRYRLVRPISTGGMARVFEARRESMHGVAPKVAVKVILPDFARDRNFQQLFVNEARIGSLLHHQNLVQIQDFDFEHDRYYLVMEYVEGPTLRRSMSLSRRHGLVPPLAVVAEIGRQVAEGLAYAHDARSEEGQLLGLVHRDVKPSNLILTPQGTVKVLDFGISKALIAREREGAVRGTWGYMAPEQADGVNVGPQADLFGLAAVLYEAAAQEPLFPEKEPGDIRALLARDEAARRAARLVGPYGPLSRVLVRALQRDPAARFSTASAMARALAEVASDPVGAREALVHFQSSIVALDKGVSPPVERSRSVSTLAVPAGPGGGLPVAVGDQNGPQRVGDIRVDARPQGVAPQQAGSPGSGLMALVAVIGLAIVLHGLEGPRPAGRRAWGRPRPRRSAWTSLHSNACSPVFFRRGGDASDTRVGSVRLWNGSGRSGDHVSARRVWAAGWYRGFRTGGGEPEKPALGSASSGPPPVVDRPGAAAADGASAPEAQAPAVPAVQTTPEAPKERAAALGMGLLTISAIPRAQVIVDGRYVRYSPLFRHEVGAGERVVTLITDDGRRTTFSLDVPDGRGPSVYSFKDGAFVASSPRNGCMGGTHSAPRCGARNPLVHRMMSSRLRGTAIATSTGPRVRARRTVPAGQGGEPARVSPDVASP